MNSTIIAWLLFIPSIGGHMTVSPHLYATQDACLLDASIIEKHYRKTQQYYGTITPSTPVQVSICAQSQIIKNTK